MNDSCFYNIIRKSANSELSIRMPLNIKLFVLVLRIKTMYNELYYHSRWRICVIPLIFSWILLLLWNYVQHYIEVVTRPLFLENVCLILQAVQESHKVIYKKNINIRTSVHDWPDALCVYLFIFVQLVHIKVWTVIK